jgi:predicted nucleic acid-binding protein
MSVVVNASPLIFLSKLKHLDLLRQCFTRVIAPQAVIAEVGDSDVPDWAERGTDSIAGRRAVRSGGHRPPPPR